MSDRAAHYTPVQGSCDKIKCANTPFPNDIIYDVFALHAIEKMILNFPKLCLCVSEMIVIINKKGETSFPPLL